MDLVKNKKKKREKQGEQKNFPSSREEITVYRVMLVGWWDSAEKPNLKVRREASARRVFLLCRWLSGRCGYGPKADCLILLKILKKLAHPEGTSFRAHPEGTSFRAHPEGTSFRAHPEGTSFRAHPEGTSF